MPTTLSHFVLLSFSSLFLSFSRQSIRDGSPLLLLLYYTSTQQHCIQCTVYTVLTSPNPLNPLTPTPNGRRVGSEGSFFFWFAIIACSGISMPVQSKKLFFWGIFGGHRVFWFHFKRPAKFSLTHAIEFGFSIRWRKVHIIKAQQCLSLLTRE
jgi:hypothetical protein